jgi:5-methyltetrahydrofolate--homocysteine methyltransferase
MPLGKRRRKVLELKESVINGDVNKVKELVTKALNEGMGFQKILDEGLVAGMIRIGECFKRNEVFVPEVLLAARAMKEGLKILEPVMVGREVKQSGKLVLGTVKGDIHDIGKNIVGTMLQGAGFKVIDLGVDVPPQKFLEAAKKEGVNLVGLSCLISTSMEAMQETITLLKKEMGKAKIFVGGAILSQVYADRMGADGYAPDGGSAIDKARELLKTK